MCKFYQPNYDNAAVSKPPLGQFIIILAILPRIIPHSVRVKRFPKITNKLQFRTYSFII